MKPAGMVIRTATVADTHAITAVQHRAFGRVAVMLGIEPTSLPPLRETCEDLAELMDGGTVFLVAISDTGDIIGSVRARTVSAGNIEIGRLVVDNDQEGLGVGTALMEAIEAQFPHARRFTLFTGADATRTIRFYEGLGYRRTTRDTSGAVELVWLEKPRLPPVCCGHD